jgi:acetyltransferase
VSAAEELGFPVVLKAVRPGLVHKSDAGGVRVGITGPSDVRAVAKDFESRLGAGPLLVQKQVPAGLELVVGVVRDPQFGPVIVFGLGGIWVEVLDDVSLRVAPFGENEARTMLGELRGAAILDGARGSPPVDRAALCGLLSAVSIWAARAPWLASLDVNPIIAANGRLTAVDARVRIATESQ